MSQNQVVVSQIRASALVKARRIQHSYRLNVAAEPVKLCCPPALWAL